MKIERSKEAAMKAINQVCKENAVSESSRQLSLDLMEIGFLHQFQKGDRKVVRDKIQELIDSQMEIENK